MLLTAYIYNGNTLGVDIGELDSREIGGNIPFKREASVSTGYANISSIINWDKFGLRAADSTVVRGEIDTLFQATTFAALTAAEKDVVSRWFLASAADRATVLTADQQKAASIEFAKVLAAQALAETAASVETAEPAAVTATAESASVPPFDPLTSTRFIEDFINGTNINTADGAIGSEGWTRHASGSTGMQSENGTSKHPGILRRRCSSSTVGTKAAIALNYSTSTAPYAGLASTKWKMVIVAQQDMVDNCIFRFGLHGTNPYVDDGTDYIGFRTTHTATAGAIFAVCRKASIETATSMGVTLAAPASADAHLDFHRYTISSDGAGTISFQVDSGAVVTINTNVPTVALAPALSVSDTGAAAASRAYRVDLVTFTQELSSAR